MKNLSDLGKIKLKRERAFFSFDLRRFLSV